MKIATILLSLLLLPAVLSAKINADYKFYLDNVNSDNQTSFTGTLTLTSDKDIKNLSIAKKGFYDVVVNGKELVVNEDTLHFKLNQNTPFEISYKKKITKYDTVTANFLSILNIAPEVINFKDIVYSFDARFPKDFVGIVSNDKKVNNIFYLNHPLIGTENIHVVASKDFVVESKSADNITVSTYLFKKDKDLADKYINAVYEYITYYEKIFKTKYPYDQFSVVEVKSPVGYAVPTYTAIGEVIIKFPFIIDISLMHEVLHQWFGVAIGVKDNQNWSEALTTYYSDYYYNIKNNSDTNYRKKILDSYMTHVDQTDKINALISFEYNKSRKDQTIGYGKGVFLFIMLADMIGTDTFNNSISAFIKKYLFKEANWRDLLLSFQAVNNKNTESLSEFMLVSTNMIEFKNFKSKIDINKGNYFIEVEYDRMNGPANINIGYTVESEGKTIVGKKPSLLGTNKFKVQIPSPYAKIYLDKEFKLFRSLTKPEIPITVSKFLNSKNIIAVTDSNECDDMIKQLKIKKTFSSKTITMKDINDSSILVCSKNNPIIEFLISDQDIDLVDDKSISSYKTYKNLLSNKDNYILLANNPSAKNSRLIEHYGDAYKLIFDGVKIINKESDKTEDGILVYSKKSDISFRQLGNINDIVQDAIKSDIIFIGETHTNYAHHLNQLEIIKKIYAQDKNITIAFEMIQEQFQPILDSYTSGKISEKEFLEKSEFITRWGYDYRLYSPIIKFIAENKIPAVALNIDTAIVKKISSGKYDQLTKDEKASLPQTMNIDNVDFYDELKDIFDMHPPKKGMERDFSKFYLIQNIWDEIMAENLYTYVKKNPSRKVIVISGSMHSLKNSAIPYRYKRISGEDSYVVLQDSDSSDPKIADGFIYTENMEVPSSPSLGLALKENKKKKTVTITNIKKNSLSDIYGMRVNDVILDCDKVEIDNIFTLKYLLINSDPDKQFQCTIDRKGILINIPITLKS